MGKKKITIDQFKDEVKELTGDEFEVISTDMPNSKTPLDLLHNECGNIIKRRRDDFLRGRRCPICSGKQKKTTDMVKKELFKVVGDEYELTNEYVNNGSELLLVHKTCGETISSTYKRFFTQGCRCFKCFHDSRKIKMTTEEYKSIVKDIHNEEYSILGEYEDKTTKILTRHNKCGHEWEISPFQFVDRRDGCPMCNKVARINSKYTLVIEEVLKENNLVYEKERPICKNPDTNRYLYADFFLEEYNLVIEYDGKQHFKPMFNDTEKLVKQKKRDKIKNDYLLNNNINLLRIPYTVYKKEELKTVILNKLKSISSQDL